MPERLTIAALTAKHEETLNRIERLERDFRELLGRVSGLEIRTGLSKSVTLPGSNLTPVRVAAERAFAKLMLRHPGGPSGDDRSLAGVGVPLDDDGPPDGSPDGSPDGFNGGSLNTPTGPVPNGYQTTVMGTAFNDAALQAIKDAEWKKKLTAERKRVVTAALKPPSPESAIRLHGAERTIADHEQVRQKRLQRMQRNMDEGPAYVQAKQEREARASLNGGDSASSVGWSKARNWK